jgi:DNA-binding MarR family transcriptional regulator
MRKASRVVTQFYDRKLKPAGIKITQFTILSMIATNEKRTLISLAEDLLMDRTTLTRGLSILLKEDFIMQVKAKDSRKKIMKLTLKGHAALDKAIPFWLEAEDEIMDECKKFDFSVF